MILLVDNYDSFVFNLARYFERLGQPTHVVRNDALSVNAVRTAGYRALVLSPGPCTPDKAGISLELVRQLYGELPILGVCLGHQTIAEAFGGRVIRAPEPRHGRTSQIYHRQGPLFDGCPNPFTAGRYHSLVVDPQTLPECLKISASTEEGLIMALEHRSLPIYGVQFHPESILTTCGYPLLGNFLRLAGLEIREPLPTLQSEREELVAPPTPLPNTPVTF